MGYFLRKLAEESDEPQRQRTLGRSLRDAGLGAGIGVGAAGAATGLAYGGARAAKNITARRATAARNAYNKAKTTIYDNPLDKREALEEAAKKSKAAKGAAKNARGAVRAISNAAKKNWKWAVPVTAGAGALKGLIHGGKQPVEQQG